MKLRLIFEVEFFEDRVHCIGDKIIGPKLFKKQKASKIEAF